MTAPAEQTPSGSRSRTRALRAWVVVAIIVALVLVVLIFVAMTVNAVFTSATVGKAEAAAGAKALASQDATEALIRFQAASASFTAARGQLRPEWLGKTLSKIPWVGPQYATAISLLDIGEDAARGGAEFAEALQHGMASSSATSGIAGQLTNSLPHAEAGLQAMSKAADRVGELPDRGLVPPLARQVASVRSALGSATPYLARANSLLPLASYLFSSEHRILVVSQDGAELRPTGGFAGSFGLLDVGPAGIHLERYDDVYVLPDPPGVVKPPLWATMTKDFSFRDANWWLDYPTSARQMLNFWSACRQPKVDGVVAIDTVAMKELLAKTGPVYVASYKETFTSDNLLERLLFLVEMKRQPFDKKKGVLTALAQTLEHRMLDSGPAELMRSAVVLGTAADAKHVQLYFTDQEAQRAVTALGWSGTVVPPPGTTDMFAASNAMRQAGKVNIAMNKRIDYSVSLRVDHSADTTLALSFANTGPYPNARSMPSRFNDWLRVYRMPGTRFPCTTPDGSRTVALEEFGFPAEGRLFVLQRQQKRIETFVATVPNAIEREATPGTRRVAWHYRLHVVRQTDLSDIPLRIDVTIPSGWRVQSASARLTSSGAKARVSVQSGTVHMALPLSGDLDLDIQLLAP